MRVDVGDIRNGGVHVWRARLDVADEALERCLRVLSPEERARADRFHFESDRRRFIAARGLLRNLLGWYTRENPARIEFRFLEQGKPFLIDAGLQFNLSHSHDRAAYAISDRQLGIDIEHIRPMPDAMEIAERFFSPREVAALKRVSEDRRIEAFFTCWTRKEAYIKAVGTGLSMPLQSFSVSLEHDSPALLDADDPSELTQWSFANVDTGEQFVGSLAVKDGLRSLTQLDIDAETIEDVS